MPNTIQLKENSISDDHGGAPYGTDSDGDLNMFNLKHDSNGLYLNSNNGDSDTRYNPSNRFVCVVSRNYPCFSPPSAESFLS